MLPESRAVNVAVTWEESCCAYPGRSCRRKVGESESRSNNELQEVSRSHSTLRNQEQSDQRFRSGGVQVSWILHREEWKRHLHPCAPKVTEQGKGKAETTDQAQPRTQRPQSDGRSESVHPRMAWLLPCGRDEADDEVLG